MQVTLANLGVIIVYTANHYYDLMFVVRSKTILTSTINRIYGRVTKCEMTLQSKAPSRFPHWHSTNSCWCNQTANSHAFLSYVTEKLVSSFAILRLV
jgi:hypothetical protein